MHSCSLLSEPYQNDGGIKTKPPRGERKTGSGSAQGCQPIQEVRRQMKEQTWPHGAQDGSWTPAGDRQEPSQGVPQNPGQAHCLEALGNAKGRGEAKAVFNSSYQALSDPHPLPTQSGIQLKEDGLIVWYNKTRESQELGTPGTLEGRVWCKQKLGYRVHNEC